MLDMSDMTCECNTCGKEMIIGVQVYSDRVSYIVVSDEKIDNGDHRPLLVCMNADCEKFGIVVINPKLIRNRIDLQEAIESTENQAIDS